MAVRNMELEKRFVDQLIMTIRNYEDFQLVGNFFILEG